MYLGQRLVLRVLQASILELQVTDNYGAVTKMIKTVIIEREPNEAPIIDMKIRQGSELNDYYKMNS